MARRRRRRKNGDPSLDSEGFKDVVRRTDANPQLVATGYWKEVDHPSEGKLRMPDIPPRFSKTKPEITRLQPRLGEHSVEVLKEAGFTGAEIDAMLKSGATKTA